MLLKNYYYDDFDTDTAFVATSPVWSSVSMVTIKWGSVEKCTSIQWPLFTVWLLPEKNNPLPLLNTVSACYPFEKVASSCLRIRDLFQLRGVGWATRTRRELTEGREDDATLWGRGEPGCWGSSVEADGERKEETAIGQGLPTISI